MMDFLKQALQIILRVLGFLSVPLLIFSVVMMIKNLKKLHAIRPRGVALQTLSPVLVFVVYSLLLGLEPPKIPAALLFIGGIALGVLASRATHLGLREGQVIGQRSVWYLIAWAVTFSITQLLAVFTRAEYASWGFSTMYFSFGLTIGTNATLLARRQNLLAGNGSAATPPVPSPPTAPPGPAVAMATAIPTGRSSCPHCAAPLEAGSRFCTRCGVRLA